MKFIQAVELSTTRLDEMRRLGDEWETAAGADRTVRRRILCEDRDRPGHYVNLVFFDSHEEAMANSELPATQELARRLAALADGELRYYNLDVLDERD